MIRSYSVAWTMSIAAPPVAGDVHRIAAAFQAARQKVGNPFFVFYYEDPHD